MELGVTGVNELVLEVVDLEASERFYSGLLGLPVVERWPDREAFWVMAGDRTRIGLWRPQVGLARGRGGIHVHFAMHIAEADYDAAVARLKERGAYKEEHAFPGNVAFHRNPLEAPPPRRDVMAVPDRLHRHETDIVSVARVFGTGIAEADEKQHGVNGAVGECASRKR